MKKISDFELKGKRVLVRCDFNVPLDEKGNILDDLRIKETIPTIEYLIKRKAKIILMSHLGDPGGKAQDRLRLTKIRERLIEYLNLHIALAKDCIGSGIEKYEKGMAEGEILLLENLRFHKGEEADDDSFAKSLAKLGDIFLNEAFSVAHRRHASVVGITKYLPFAIGPLFEKEIKILSQVLENPARPLVVVIGGAKIESKTKVIEKFLKIADQVILGGEIVNTILGVKGILVGRPLPKKEILETVARIDLTNPKLHLPIDGVITLADFKKGLEEGYLREGALGKVRQDEGVFDIGPQTIDIFSKIIKDAKTIFWSGPPGMFEVKEFEKGTREISEAITRNHLAFRVAGGGDTISALNKFGIINRFAHISLGGGAMLSFLSGDKLPGLEALK